VTVRGVIDRVFQQPALNFVVTNRIPRRGLTRFMGWFSRIENPLVRSASLAVFRLFADDLALHEAKKTRFRSLHDCFVRELKVGARPLDRDPAVLVSPCDAVVGAAGRIEGAALVQAKRHRYTLDELLLDSAQARAYADGIYATLRLKANMYHRFHAPHDCRVTEVRYVPGDAWNVNPPALERVPRVFARNERAVVRARLDLTGQEVTLVPVAAILVAGLRLSFLDLDARPMPRGPSRIACDARLGKGEEMGWFEHGSTIIVVGPVGLVLADAVRPGALIRMGEPLMRLVGRGVAQ
jgi:phosphatidylserine decarboxylase